MQICLLYSVIYFKKFVRLIWPGVGSKLEQGKNRSQGAGDSALESKVSALFI